MCIVLHIYYHFSNEQPKKTPSKDATPKKQSSKEKGGESPLPKANLDEKMQKKVDDRRRRSEGQSHRKGSVTAVVPFLPMASIEFLYKFSITHPNNCLLKL